MILPIINILLIASATTACSYWLFYYFSPFIWSFNSTLPYDEYVPWISGAVTGHNGVQVYVLYLLMFLNLGFSFILSAVFLNIRKPSVRVVFLSLSLVLSLAFFHSIGFYVPMSLPAATVPGFMLVGAVFLITLFLSLNYKARWIPVLVGAFLFLICLVTATGISRQDYNYILSPSWRFLHGFGLNQTFSQYDYLLPILVAGWIKLLPLKTISLLGRFSYFALFLGAYLFAKKFFNNKQLAAYLLISMVIIKIYGNLVPMDGIIQVTPWRLDWWIVLLALAYWKTAHHWTVAAVLGFLIIFHHSFGCIYTISYFIFILMLNILEGTSRKDPLTHILKKYLSLYLKNFILIVAAFLIYNIFLQPQMDNAVFFQKTGIGFLQIDKASFYWYMPVIFAAVFLLLLKRRFWLSLQYFEASVFLLSLAIGNSMYFFGRSHENNIINIAAVLLMVFFLFLDLVHLELEKLVSKKLSQWIVPGISTAFILMISYQYAGGGVKLLDTQISNLKKHCFFADNFLDLDMLDFSQLKTVTHGSPQVIFLSLKDFFLYNAGKYELPQDYNCSTSSWFIMKGYLDYLNEHLNKGYYIVVPRDEMPQYMDVISSLKAQYFTNTFDFLVISNNPLRGFDKTLWTE